MCSNTLAALVISIKWRLLTLTLGDEPLGAHWQFTSLAGLVTFACLLPTPHGNPCPPHRVRWEGAFDVSVGSTLESRKGQALK